MQPWVPYLASLFTAYNGVLFGMQLGRALGIGA